MDELYAKSGTDGPTIAAHCRDVREAAEAILAAVGNDLAMIVPGLTVRLPNLLAAAALLHDILKANSAFQDMVRLPRGQARRQPVRHELLAAVLLTNEGPLADWFRRVLPDESDRWAVVWAVAGHHFKMTNPALKPSAPLYRDRDSAPRVTVRLAHEQVRTLLADVAGLLSPSVPVPPLTDLWFDTADDEAGSLRELVRRYPATACAAWKKMKADPATRTAVAALKALLAAADAAGSALTERGLPPTEWVRRTLGRRLSPEDLEPVVQRDLMGAEPRAFQKEVEESKSAVTVVAAGCGNGKTTAAYLWAKKRADGKKLFFSYPTTGTATAGFLSYLAIQRGLTTDLIHGKSEVDLAAIRANPGTAGKDREDQAERLDEQREAESRIDSLRAWSANVVNCTVDTILGLMQTQRRGVYSFPAFAAGAFVFDEIHAYDARLWGGLLRFLKEFPGVPALLMSASIPPHREKQLRDELGSRVGKLIGGDPDLEKRKRYLLEARTEAECWADVCRALADEKKVLWVCNTVKYAVRIARDAPNHTHVKPIIFHSRFCYRDRAGDGKGRKGRQNEVVEAFEYHKEGPKKGRRVRPGPTLVIATQVCEMSLDISADLLVTAECPLPALVQRLGRLNRYAAKDDPWPCLVYPFEGLPYNEDTKGKDLYGDYSVSMSATRKVVTDMAGRGCSQKDLATRLNEMADTEAPEEYSALFDDGWVTEPMPVRDGDQTITVISAGDLDEIEREVGKNRSRWPAGKLAPWTIPMNYPKGLRPFEWERAGPYPIAAEDVLSYSEAEGAEWRTS
jgi:CRISPR-associated endonuclease/helicase Cas3